MHNDNKVEVKGIRMRKWDRNFRNADLSGPNKNQKKRKKEKNRNYFRNFA